MTSYIVKVSWLNICTWLVKCFYNKLSKCYQSEQSATKHFIIFHSKFNIV